ncbi:hypothetical protein L9F63_015558 [Diploptera punctata]|uniref:Uncharacterized protein n=1 Tax=Diploptera punctata TaxID=6984 RepID=A0AAD8EJD6_DIPPU|nr:hypothetical protein L9F63_015558 [Diploptera punctata]
MNPYLVNDDFGEPCDVYGYNYDMEGPPETDYDCQGYTNIPDVVRRFLIYFRNCINEGLIFEIQNLYENTFPKLTDQYFDKKPWPSCEEVALLVDDDIFLILYKELYYRHLYARVSGCPTVEQRAGSYSNYCELFNILLNSESPVPLELPDQWLWGACGRVCVSIPVVFPVQITTPDKKFWRT